MIRFEGHSECLVQSKISHDSCLAFICNKSIKIIFNILLYAFVVEVN